ncbi:MAG: D-alanyl-D-alanine carboxypeptidase/D-alanyl-D-alanine-endopeptidase, partial [Leucothrix sp.]
MKIRFYGSVLWCGLFIAMNGFAADQDLIKKPPVSAKRHQTVTEVPQSGLTDSLSALLKKLKVSPDDLSVYIQDVNANQPMLSHNIDIARSPASTIKLVTTYAALNQLGPNYSWPTEAWTRGEISNGILEGDLILKGYGDPFLVYERYWKFVNALKDRGLKAITGNIIIDSSYYRLPEHDRSAFDGQGFRVYNAGVSPLMFNFQATRLMLSPPTADTSTDVNITLYPPSDTLTIENKV